MGRPGRPSPCGVDSWAQKPRLSIAYFNELVFQSGTHWRVLHLAKRVKQPMIILLGIMASTGDGDTSVVFGTQRKLPHLKMLSGRELHTRPHRPENQRRAEVVRGEDLWTPGSSVCWVHYRDAPEALRVCQLVEGTEITSTGQTFSKLA